MVDSTSLPGERWKGTISRSISSKIRSSCDEPIKWTHQLPTLKGREAPLLSQWFGPLWRILIKICPRKRLSGPNPSCFLVINPPQTGSISGSTNWLSAVSLPGEKLFCLIASVPLIVFFSCLLWVVFSQYVVIVIIHKLILTPAGLPAPYLR